MYIGKAIYPNTFDANNSIVCAGYIDIHTHGGFGKDCMEATKDAIETICKYHLSTGITSFVDAVRRIPEGNGLRRPRMLKMEEAL